MFREFNKMQGCSRSALKDAAASDGIDAADWTFLVHPR